MLHGVRLRVRRLIRVIVVKPKELAPVEVEPSRTIGIGAYREHCPAPLQPVRLKRLDDSFDAQTGEVTGVTLWRDLERPDG